MQVCVVQLAYGDGETVAERTLRTAELLRVQPAADLVLLPELWPQGGFAYDRWKDEAQGLDGFVVEVMAAVARERVGLLHMGSFVERRNGQLFNTSVLLSPQGEIVATYRKIHLFGFSEGEPKLMTAGQDLVVHEQFGFATCYDLRFPEMFRALVDRGAHVLLLTSAWPARRVEHWRVLVRARAIENQMYVVACNTGGEHAGVLMGGHSMVVDPWGRIVAEAGEGEEVLCVEIDLAMVESARERFPVLDDRVL